MTILNDPTRLALTFRSMPLKYAGLLLTAAACSASGAERPPTLAPQPTLSSEGTSERSADAVEVAAADVSEAALGDGTPAPPTPAATRELPSSCANAAACFPPAAFVDAVCRKKFPDLPLQLFAKRMPWQRLYVKAEWVEPVNVHGGDQSEAWMKFGEEVLVLRKKGASSSKGVQLSGPTDLDVLRWDGTCATIREEMLVSYVPGPMLSPRIIWKYLSAEVQEALLEVGAVSRARDNERKSCRDSSVTHPTGACEQAMQKLTVAIVNAVRQDVELPASIALPQWTK